MIKRFAPMLTFLLMVILNDTSIAQEPGNSHDSGKNGNPSKMDKVKWNSFEDAYKLNKKKHKKIFVDVYTNWCGWCKKMDADTYTNPVIVRYLNKNFYCVRLDAERKDSITLDGVSFVNERKRGPHQLAIDLLNGNMSYPSLVFINEEGKKMAVIPGYKAAKEFEFYIHYFGDDAFQKNITWEEFLKTFSGEIK